MSPTVIKIIAIILFAVAAALLYGWGVIKSQHLDEDLYRKLYIKGADGVLKVLKKKDYILMTEIENQVQNIQASVFYSKRRASVQDKRDFARKLVQTMMERDLIEEDMINGKKAYRRKEGK